jgi:hypothetical protein
MLDHALHLFFLIFDVTIPVIGAMFYCYFYAFRKGSPAIQKSRYWIALLFCVVAASELGKALGHLSDNVLLWIEGFTVIPMLVCVYIVTGEKRNPA